jgi:hypothetical protein
MNALDNNRTREVLNSPRNIMVQLVNSNLNSIDTTWLGLEWTNSTLEEGWFYDYNGDSNYLSNSVRA